MADRGDGAALARGACLGPYRLEALLGRGRMGSVFRARAASGEVVALKVLDPELADDDAFRRRFEREGRIAAAVRHRHLVAVVDQGEIDGRQYLACRYLPGGSLADRVAPGRLDPPAVARIVAHVGAGLDALHRAGLVHRDVKPSNVMLDADGSAALTDFGVARGEADTALTKRGRVVGTVDYLAPEVISGEPATPASDVYGLGCVAYECATGAPPFADRQTLAEACVAHLRDEPPRPDVPTAFADALLKALAKEPSKRPATATAYARLLQAGAKGL